MAKFKEIIKLQKICCFSLTNFRLIQRTRSYDHSETDIKALLYNTYSSREGFDTFLVNLQLITIWTPGINGFCFLANNLQSINTKTLSKRCDRPLQCLTGICGREVRFKGFWSAPETEDQSKQDWLWLPFVCVFSSVFLSCTPNFSSLAWFFNRPGVAGAAL